MKDIDRWLERMGPEPAGLHQLRDAARAAPEMTPDQRERMKRDLFAALDERERQWEAKARRARRVRRAFGATLAVAAVVMLWIKWPPPEERETAKGPPLHNTGDVVRVEHGPPAPSNAVTSPTASAVATDAGPDGAP